MKKRWFLVGVMFLLVPWLLVGCGVAQEEYDAVVAERDTAQAELQSIKTELQSVKDELAASQSKVSELTSSLEKAQTDLEVMQSDFEKTKKELTEIKEVYPPGDFYSSAELRDWLLINDVSERPDATNAENLYLKALEIQENALRDGYIISAYIDYLGEDMFVVVCEAVAGGEVWMWNPESDELVNFSDLSGLLKLK